MEIGKGFIQSNLGNDFIPVRLLFDSASNGSYGKKTSMQDLKFEKVGERNLQIDTFCEGEVKCQSCDVIKLVIHDTNNFYEPTEICISTMDFLCKDVTTWQLSSFQSKCINNIGQQAFCPEAKPLVSIQFWVAESESGIRFFPSRHNFAVLPISWLPGLKISFSSFSEKLREISKI